jgi:hypothetical protein
MATQNNVVAREATGAGGGAARQQNGAPRGRIVILNALPLNALPRRHIQLDVLPVSLQDLAQWIQRRVAEGYEVIHFVRHTSTIQLLRSLGVPLSETPNSGLYSYQHGDLLVVVSLRAPQRGQEATQVSLQDLETWVVTVL